MKLVWTLNAWDDYEFWQKADLRMVEKINEIIKNAKRTPFAGLGKPEPLKGDLSGFWSRRIDDSHRLVYTVEKDAILIAQCRDHY